MVSDGSCPRRIWTQVSYVRADQLTAVNVLISAEGLRGARLCVADAQIVQAAFFDDEELAVVFRIGNMQHLATIAISSVQEMLSEPLAMDRRSVEMVSTCSTKHQLTLD